MATSKTTTAAKAPAKKAAAPSKATASTKAKPAAKPAVKAPAAKAPVKAKPAPAVKAKVQQPVAKKQPDKAAPKKAVQSVKSAAAEVKSTADDLAAFGKQVELFQVPSSATAKAPAQTVKVVETTEVKVSALPASSSKLVTGDHREPKVAKPQPRFDKKAQHNKGGYKGNKPQQTQQHRRSGDPRHQMKSNDPRSNLTRKLLGENAGAHSSAPAETPVSLLPGIGAPAAQFASEALKAIKHATPETISKIADQLAENVVEQFGTDAGNLATSVVKKMTPSVDPDGEGSLVEVVAESMERAKLESLPPDAAAKRSLRGALNKLMTNQHEVMNAPAKKNANGMLDLTSLFKSR